MSQAAVDLVAFDLVAFDLVAFDLVAFDLAAFDLAAFDLAGVMCRFDPARLRVLGDAAGLPTDVVQARIWDAGLDRAGDEGRLSAAQMSDAVRAALDLGVDDASLRALSGLVEALAGLASPG